MAVITRFRPAVQPLYGALLGVCGAGLIVILPRGAGTIPALILWIGVTLAQGERGFANWFPKLPLFGTLLAGCTVLLRWYALTSLERTVTAHLYATVVAALTAGAAAAVALAWISRPVGEEAFRKLSRLTTTEALIAIAEGLA